MRLWLELCPLFLSATLVMRRAPPQPALAAAKVLPQQLQLSRLVPELDKT